MNDTPALSSAELIRQAREALNPPKSTAPVSTQVDAPSIQDLLSKPLSSDSLLPQRAVDYWDDEIADTAAAPWEPIDRSASSSQEVVPSQPPPPVVDETAHPRWLEPMREELGLPPAPTRAPRPARAPRPTGPPAAPPQKAKVPWRLLIFGFVAASVFLGSLADDDATSIEVGGCYDSVNLVEADAVDCAQPHSVQVFALVVVDDAGAIDRCFDEAVRLRDSGAVPETFVMPNGVFAGAIEASSTSAGDFFCYLESRSGGLIGSFVPE